jgi:agmatinase
MPIRTGPLPRTAGILTFARAPRSTIDDLRPGTVAVLGVPYETSSPSRRGPLYGPQAYRETSTYYWAHTTPGGGALVEIDSRERVVPDVVHARLRDLGDVPVSHVDWPETENLLRETLRRIVARGAVPVCLGGDHFVTYPLVLGYRDAVRAGGGAGIGYVQFSSRLDLGDEDPVFGHVWRGATVRRILDAGAVRPGNVAWIGVHGYVRGEEWALAQRLEARIFTPDDVRRRGIEAVVAEALRAVGEGCEAVYASVDVDVVDGGHVAMTGVPQFDGLRNVDLWRAMDLLPAGGVGALDVTGLNPLVETMSLGKTGQRFGVHLVLRFVYGQLARTPGASGGRP